MRILIIQNQPKLVLMYTTVEPWYDELDSKQKIIYNYIDIACMYSMTQITNSIHGKVHSNEVCYDTLLDTIAWIPNSLYQGFTVLS